AAGEAHPGAAAADDGRQVDVVVRLVERRPRGQVRDRLGQRGAAVHHVGLEDVPRRCLGARVEVDAGSSTQIGYGRAVERPVDAQTRGAVIEVPEDNG